MNITDVDAAARYSTAAATATATPAPAAAGFVPRTTRNKCHGGFHSRACRVFFHLQYLSASSEPPWRLHGGGLSSYKPDIGRANPGDLGKRGGDCGGHSGAVRKPDQSRAGNFSTLGGGGSPVMRCGVPEQYDRLVGGSHLFLFGL